MKSKALFITGVTGFIGSNLAERLEKETNDKIFVLARNKGGLSAKERITKLLPDFGGEVVDGDICLGDDFGMSDYDKAMLAGFEIEVWHVAGNVSFDTAKSGEVFRVNFDGTKNVLGFIRKMGIKRLHYISTAYVAGDRRGLGGIKEKIAFENEDFVGQKFHNSYEESKLQAEILVKSNSSLFNIDTTVYRISVAVGDSITGKTSTFSGYYAYMRKLKSLKDKMERSGKNGLDGISVKIPSSAIVNIACVDYMVDTILAIAKNNKSIGGVFHVVNPNPPASIFLIKSGLKILGVKNIKIINDDSSVFNTGSEKLERKIANLMSCYHHYARSDLVFDNSNVRSVVGILPTHPVINEKLIKKLLDYAIKHNFGKSIKKKEECVFA